MYTYFQNCTRYSRTLLSTTSCIENLSKYSERLFEAMNLRIYRYSSINRIMIPPVTAVVLHQFLSPPRSSE